MESEVERLERQLKEEAVRRDKLTSENQDLDRWRNRFLELEVKYNEAQQMMEELRKRQTEDQDQADKEMQTIGKQLKIAEKDVVNLKSKLERMEQEILKKNNELKNLLKELGAKENANQGDKELLKELLKKIDKLSKQCKIKSLLYIFLI